MQKAGIITKNKDSNHTQTKFIELEPLGREFGRLLESGNNFYFVYSRLREKIKGNFNLSERSHEKVRENLLRSKGWTDKEISSYEKTSDDVITFERSLLPLMVQGLVNRYILILSRFNPTKNAKEILDAILTDTLNKGILVMLENIATNNSSGGDILHTEDSILELGPYGGLLFDFIDDLGSFLICNRFIKEEIKNAIASLFSLFNPPKRYVEHHITQWIEILKVNPQQQALLHLYKELNKLS
jgi:hypothetical protein